MKKKGPYIEAVLLSAAMFFLSPPLWAEDSTFPIDGLKPKIEALLKPVMEGEKCPGMGVGLIYQGQTRVWGYGTISSKNKNTPNAGTEFGIASITKLFTDLLVSGLVHQGKFGLDDPVQKYLPAGVTMPSKDGVQITFRMLANYRSGLHSDDWDFSTVKSLYQFLNQTQLASVPGQLFQYNSSGHELLGVIACRETGLDYEALLHQVILDPLGLKDTGLTWTPDQLSRGAEGTENGKTMPYLDFSKKDPVLGGNGSIHSNLTDLLKLAGAALDKGKSPIQKIAFDDTAAKLQWGPVVSHFGEWNGFTSSFYVDRINGMALVIWGRTSSDKIMRLADSLRDAIADTYPPKPALPMTEKEKKEIRKGWDEIPPPP